MSRPDEARPAYDAWHGAYDVDTAADAPWQQLVRRHLPALDGKRVLEIGCGRGGFSAWLARHGATEVVAADFSRVAVAKGSAYARASGLGDLHFAVGDILAIAHPTSTFDIVVSCETIEHVADPRRAVRELARVLKPGGLLLLTTPNYLGIMGLYRAYRRLTGRPYTELGQPVNHFTMLPRTRAWIRRAGLRVVASDAVGHYLPVPGRPPMLLWRLDRRAQPLRALALHSLVVAAKPVSQRARPLASRAGRFYT